MKTKLFIAFCTIIFNPELRTFNCLAQNISGVINTYTKVTGISSCNSLTVTATAGYNAGDTVLLIQMKGATIDTISNTTAFGTILNYNEAGNYEFNIIQTINGNNVLLQNALIKSYNPDGLVQLIRVPYYNNVTVSGALSAQAWDGNTGGVLILQAAGAITLNADIDVSGMGFIKGNASLYSFSPPCDRTDYYCTMASYYSAQKGEGISASAIAYEAGRGALANGGGGGNSHNAGGGGGGNYGRGGRGGDQTTSGCSQLSLGGEGGYLLNYSNSQNKIFLGGGGGGGHQNNFHTTAGTNGGGIIIIKANVITGNNFYIKSNGIDNVAVSGDDGAGGGGAGGTILLDISNYNPTVLNIQANGGKGGNATTSANNFGPGGGGSGGVVWANGGSLPGNVSTFLAGGLSGKANFSNSPYGAAPGASGGILYNLELVNSDVFATGGISSQNVLCNSQCSGVATVIVSGCSSPYTYLWNTIPEQTTQTVTGLCAGTYTVMVIDTYNDTAYNSVTIVEPALFTVTATVGTILCNGELGILAAEGTGGTMPYLYFWSNEKTNSSISGLMAGTYTVTLTDNNGCATKTSVILTEPSLLTASLTTTDAMCNGVLGSASVSINGGTQPYIWVWDNGQTGHNITGLPAGTYTVIITDSNGCNTKNQVIINGSAEITASIISSPNICAGQTGVASTTVSSGGIAPFSYNWSNGQTTPVITGLGEGVYTVTVTDTSGCIKTLTVTLTTIIIQPTVTVSSTQVNILPGDSTQLNVSGEGSYLWSPATGLNCTTCFSPTAKPEITTDYCVQITDANGCTNSTCITINVDIKCGEIFVPTAFSPNNDGQNELQCILGNCIQSMTFVIYNRWGEKIFETTDPKECWDGKQKGKFMKTTVLAYYLRAILLNDKEIIKHGNVTLIQ